MNEMLQTQPGIGRTDKNPEAKSHAQTFKSLAELPEIPRPPTEQPATAENDVPAPSTGKVSVKFALFEPHARSVQVTGSFNDWCQKSNPMARREDGHWETSVALKPGKYEYKFVVDGQWIPDPSAALNVWNDRGTLNSVVQVEG